MTTRQVKAILKPQLGVGPGYGKCKLCETETSWTVNGKFVCPRCCLAQGWIKEWQLPDACEVCGNQGEWCCGADDEHSLCHRHRDAWFSWTKRDILLDERFDQLPEAEKDKAWEKCFTAFVSEMKGDGEIEYCPYCEQLMPKKIGEL